MTSLFVVPCKIGSGYIPIYTNSDIPRQEFIDYTVISVIADEQVVEHGRDLHA